MFFPPRLLCSPFHTPLTEKILVLDLMDAAAQDTSLEAAIAWLVQTILATLLMDKLDSWIRHAGFGDDIERLKSEVRRVGMVVCAVKGRAVGSNQPLLAQSLAILRELLYDAGDVVDQLDYYSLQQQVQGVTTTTTTAMHPANEISSGNAADTPMNSSVGKLRSAVWEHFRITEKDYGKPVKSACRYCGKEFTCKTRNGTSSMSKHVKMICTNRPPGAHQPNPSSTGDATQITSDSSSGKRRKTHQESTQTATTSTHIHWDKVELSNSIQKLTSQLHNIQGEVSEVLKLCGSGSASSSNHQPSITSDQHLPSSSLVLKKVYGRAAEMDTIKRLIAVKKSNGVIVLPIVGIGGVGKTTLAQLVYNDPGVKSKFDHRIWIWVSRNFDEMRFTREMLDFVPQETHEVPQERHEGISSFAKLQEILASRTNSKRLLLVLDDVWYDTDDRRWIQLLAPIKSNAANGNVILVTTRKLSVAEMIGTTEPIKLGALETGYFWLLFKLHAFGDENYKGDQTLSDIGQEIAEKLKGNPLAAESTGKLLKEKLNVDHWNNILKNEDWKSLQLSGGIMTALKLSYDQLPYSLQQCFTYCSIFPDGYRLHGGELARIWISQGFVKLNNHSSKILEEIVQNYLAPLVNLGFFQQVERQESSPGSQTCYALCGLMHDFARMVSLTECTTIDGIRSNKMSPTIRHLSIVTDSEYRKNEHGNIPRNEKFEKNLRDTVTSVSKLRTLVLLGHYDSFFLQLLQDIFRKAYNLRLLQMSAASADFPKHGYDEVDGALPQVLSKLYHLQVLNVGSYTNPTIPDGISNLVSLRHLVVHKGVYSSIATIGSLTSFQEPHGFEFQIFSNFEITQPQSTDERVHDWVHQLDNVKTLKEIYEAVLKKNELLGKLQLSTEIGMELIPNRSARSSKLSVDTAREVLERFEVRQHLKSLQIHGYKCSDATSPTCLVSNILFTSLLKLHLYSCRKWEILPSLDTLQFLTKLKLSNLRRVIQISFPSLEELVLVQMPKLERCSCTSVEGMNSRLRALQIEQCYALKEFDLFENDDDEQRSWLPGIRKLTLRDCPHLKVLKPLPPSTACFELLIGGVSTLPSMDGSSTEKLQIRYDVGKEDGDIDIGESSDESWILDDKILAFQNLRNLKSVIILDCQRLSSFSFKGFSHLFHLKNLEMRMCDLLFSSDVMTDATHEDVTAANWKAFPYLESLSIKSCGITVKWLSLLLRHAPQLEELHLGKLSIEGDTPRGLARDGLVYIPLNLISSLKKITIDCCPRLIFNWSDEGFSGITSVQELLSSLVHKGGDDDWANGRWLLPTSLDEFEISSSYFHKTLQPCFPSDLTSLKRLQVGGGPGLETLQLRSCTALEELIIYDCVLLTALEGLQYLGSLRHLAVTDCPGLCQCLESFSTQCSELCSRLETLEITDQSVLAKSFCERLTSLQRLKLRHLVLNEEQEKALLLLKSLQELEFCDCFHLVDLPAGLDTLLCLKRLKIYLCLGISRLPETGLPLSLEELEIDLCSQELADQCKDRATSKLNVKIGICSF